MGAALRGRTKVKVERGQRLATESLPNSRLGAQLKVTLQGHGKRTFPLGGKPRPILTPSPVTSKSTLSKHPIQMSRRDRWVGPGCRFHTASFPHPTSSHLPTSCFPLLTPLSSLHSVNLP